MSKSRGDIADAAREKLVTRIQDIPFSNRTLNVLARENIQFVSDLVRLSERKLLGFRGFGAKSLREVKRYLRPDLKLQSERRGEVLPTTTAASDKWPQLASSSASAAPEIPLQLDGLPESAKITLAMRVVDCQFSTRTHNALINGGGIVFIGDLVQFSEETLLTVPGLGKKCLREIRDFLRPDLRLGVPIAGWSAETAVQLEKQLKAKIAERRRLNFVKVFGKGTPVAGLEEELQRLAEVCSSNVRRSQMIISFFGWDGGGRKTLEETGKLFGVTRERVRQVTTQFENRLKGTVIQLNWLRRASDRISTLLPASTQAIEQDLLAKRILKKPFHTSGIIAAFQLTDMTLGNASLASVNAAEFLLRPSDVDVPKEILRCARRKASMFGCCSMEEVVDEVSTKTTRYSSTFVADVIRTEEDYCPLADGTWFWQKNRPRNRLLNVLRKIFSVCSSISFGELRTALTRHRRMPGFSPPRRVLREIIAQLPGCSVTEDLAICTSRPNPDRELSPLELLFVAAFREHGPVLNRDALEKILLGQGVNRTSFYIYLGYSPIISRLKPGVYALVGAEIPPGVVEEASLKLPRPKILMGSGWRKDGTLWICYRLTHFYLGSGAFIVPYPVRTLLQGSYSIRSEDEAEFGTATVRDNFVYGFAKFFKRRGGEPGDYLVVIFNLHSKTVTALLGNADLFDRLERGEDIPEDDNPESMFSDNADDMVRPMANDG